MSSMPDASQLSFRNELLAGLPPEALEQVCPHLQRVTWVIEQELHAAGHPIEHVYFP